MRDFFLEYKLLILGLTAVFFVIIFLDIIFTTTKHKIKKRKEFYKKNYGDGTVIYAGTEGGLLSYQIDDTVSLIGKPDLVMQNKKTKEIFVVDLKSGKAPIEMEKYHALQLAAYFPMIEKNFSAPIKRGIIRYLDDENKEHSVENSDELKNELLERVQAIAAAKKKMNSFQHLKLIRNHNVKHRCEVCEYHDDCPQALK